MKVKKIHFLIFLLIADLVLLAIIIWELIHSNNLTDKQITGDKMTLVSLILNAIVFSVLIYNEKKQKKA